MTHYDYIIAGSGCAGLSLLAQLMRSAPLRHKRILLIDQAIKDKNDHTWCFWEKEEGPFESIVHRSWDKALFHGDHFSRQLHFAPYRYKMIRSIDLYKHMQIQIDACPDITTLYGTVTSIISTPEKATVVVNDVTYTATYVFTSIPKPLVKQPHKHYLLQHFMGWVIRTDKPAFDPSAATLMDFRVGQIHGTSFVYTLPLSTNTALVEYTLFSKATLPEAEYEQALRQYITRNVACEKYEILETEYGIIPMTNHRFPQQEQRIVYVGGAGGQTKASTGYTFRFIQQQSSEIVAALEQGKTKLTHKPSSRFHFYDSILLHILSEDELDGKAIFSRLFRRNTPAQVLKFLDNDTSLWEDLKLVMTLQKRTFLKAAMKELSNGL